MGGPMGHREDVLCIVLAKRAAMGRWAVQCGGAAEMSRCFGGYGL